MAIVRRRFVVAAVFVLALTACGPDQGTPAPAARKNGTGQLRTDTEPLAKRFTALGQSFGALWMSGTYGDDRNPGPSTYWIDAVITLDPAKVAELTGSHQPVATGQEPDVVAGLRPQLPPGPFQASAELDAAFTRDGWATRAYLAPDARSLVLVSRGE